MIALSALGAALAVLLLVPTGSSRAATRRLRSPGRDGRGRGVAVPAVLTAVAGCAITGSLLAAGPAGGVVATSLSAVAVTTVLLIRRHLATRRADRRAGQIARACSAVAAQVLVGRVPTEALTSAAEDHDVLVVPARTLAMGGNVVACLRSESREPGAEGLAEFARAWHFSQSSGAPMAAVLGQVAISLRDDQSTRRTVAAELAGPRASGLVMAALPALGIGLGYLIGGDPIGFLLAGPVGWGCLLAGTGLALAGVLWIDRLARSARIGQDSSDH